MDQTTKEPRTKKAAGEKGTKPVHVVRIGAIAASIWLRQGQNGYAYYDFTLSRSWKSMNTGKEGYSTTFFERNAEDLTRVISEAAAWISQQPKAAADAEPMAA